VWVWVWVWVRVWVRVRVRVWVWVWVWAAEFAHPTEAVLGAPHGLRKLLERLDRLMVLRLLPEHRLTRQAAPAPSDAQWVAMSAELCFGDAARKHCAALHCTALHRHTQGMSAATMYART
jgi:hypothetical protein